MKKSRAHIRRFVFLRNISILVLIVGIVLSIRFLFDSILRFAELTR